MTDTIPRIDLIPEEDLPIQVERFRLLEVLGEGGMGRVFRAEVHGLAGFRKECALKVVRLESVTEDIARDSFINEARLGGLLNHPNVVATLDFGQIGGLPYIAMELVDGVTVDRLLRRAGGMLPASVALEIGIQICAGLAHAHALKDRGQPANLVHRDLKPSNVIVSRHGVSKVMDFGIAKAHGRVGEHTRTGVTKGTPHYMSPEQIEGEEVDRRSDVFAMGALLYAITMGKPLFVSKGSGGVLSVLLAISRVDEMLDDGVVLAEADEVAPGMARVLSRCLRSNPDERFPSAKALAVELKLVKARLMDQITLPDYVEALYGTDEFEVDIPPLYRLNTDTRDARKPDELQVKADWQSSEDPDSADTIMHPSSGQMEVRSVQVAAEASNPASTGPEVDTGKATVRKPALEVHDTMVSRRRRRLAVILGLLCTIAALSAVVVVLLVISIDPLGWFDAAPDPVVTGIVAEHDQQTPEPITETADDDASDTTPAVVVVHGEDVQGTGTTDSEEPTAAVEAAEEITAAEDTAADLVLTAVDTPTRVSVGYAKTFRVRLEGTGNAEVVLMFKAEGQDWRLHRMQQELADTWTKSLTFEADAVGRAEYYFYAQPTGDAGSRVQAGTRDSPFSIQVW
jgi:serine/threonine protein kinase